MTHRCLSHECSLIFLHWLLVVDCPQGVDQIEMRRGASSGVALNTADSLHWPLLRFFTSRCSLHDKARLSPPHTPHPPTPALGAAALLLPYVARVFAGPASPQRANRWGLMLVLLKENAGVMALCEFWHPGCLPGSVPLCFWVCCRRLSGFGDVSC